MTEIAFDDTRQTTPAFLFDLDGTLMDTVYQHVLAWSEALKAAGMQLSLRMPSGSRSCMPKPIPAWRCN